MGSIDALKQATGLTKEAPKPKTLEMMVAELAPRLGKFAAKHMNPDRLLQLVINAQRTKDLKDATPASLLGCAMQSAILGLEPGVLGQCYYIPYKNRREGITVAQFITGWQGYSDLVTRTGRAEAWTGAVYDGDEFDYSLGSRPFLHHRPNGEPTKADDPRNGRDLVLTYSCGFPKGAQFPVIEVFPSARIYSHRNRYNKVGDQHYSYTNNHNFEMYGRKISFLQVIKYLPKSPDIQTAAALDFTADAGMQRLTPDVVLDGNILIEAETGFSDMDQPGTAEQHEGNVTQSPSGSEQNKLPTYLQLFDKIGWDKQERAEWIKGHPHMNDEQMRDAMVKEFPDLVK